MDSFGLRQEQEDLTKLVSALKHKLEIGESRVKELHDEEMRYLIEIPVYKKQSEEARLRLESIDNQIVPLNQELSELYKELSKTKELISIENKSLIELRETEKKIIEETKLINEQIKNRHEELKNRQSVIENTEKLHSEINNNHQKIDTDLSNRETNLLKKEEELNLGIQELSSRIDIHNSNLSIHAENVRSIIEQRKFITEDEQAVRDKLNKANKLVKDHIDLKAALLIQSEKLAKEIEITQNKQKSLDRNIADLKNQENALKIKELQIKKMAHDAGLEKQLADLSK